MAIKDKKTVELIKLYFEIRKELRIRGYLGDFDDVYKKKSHLY